MHISRDGASSCASCAFCVSSCASCNPPRCLKNKHQQPHRANEKKLRINDLKVMVNNKVLGKVT